MSWFGPRGLSQSLIAADVGVKSKGSVPPKSRAFDVSGNLSNFLYSRASHDAIRGGQGDRGQQCSHAPSPGGFRLDD
jgi:hypothetical protein